MRDFKLKFSYQSMARMEERIGYSLIRVANDVSSMNLKLKPVVDIFYEAAVEAKEKVSYNTLADYILETGFPLVTRMIMLPVMKMLSSGAEEMPKENLGNQLPEAGPANE